MSNAYMYRHAYMPCVHVCMMNAYMHASTCVHNMPPQRSQSANPIHLPANGAGAGAGGSGSGEGMRTTGDGDGDGDGDGEGEGGRTGEGGTVMGWLGVVMGKRDGTQAGHCTGWQQHGDAQSIHTRQGRWRG